jgi:hypothetical protein
MFVIISKFEIATRNEFRAHIGHWCHCHADQNFRDPLEMSRYSARLAFAGWATVRIILSYLFRSTVVFKLVELDTAVLCIPLVVYTVLYLKHAGKVF